MTAPAYKETALSGQVADDLMLLSGDCDAGFSVPANLEGVPAKARGHPQVFGREWLCELDDICPLLQAGRKALQMSDGQHHWRAGFVTGSVIIEDEQGTRV